MGYVGGLGAGKGWRILKVLPSVELLLQLVDIPNTQLLWDSCVGANEPDLRAAHIRNTYEKWLGQWQSGEVEDFRRLNELRFHLASIWTPISVKAYDDPPRKRSSTDRPTISFSEGRLLKIDPQRQISSAYSTGIWAGFWISFPRVYASERTGFHLVDSSNLPEWHIFEELDSLVKRSTQPLVLSGFDRKIRTAIRISPEMTEVMDRVLIRHSAGFSRYGT